jgi:hypothetical protein
MILRCQLYLAETKEMYSLEDLRKDFYFRRECWRRRVRMYTPPPRGSDQASILEFVEKTDFIHDELDKLHTLEEVPNYLERFAETCKEGRFEELADVNLFQWDGKDKEWAGFVATFAWFNKNGTCPPKDKMRAAFGPWSTGIDSDSRALLSPFSPMLQIQCL